MSNLRSKDRASLCSFTFADGRRCRMPRQSGHPFLCCFHARREAHAQAAEEIGRDVRYFLSGDFLSAGDLSLALGRVFAGAARGHLKPKTAGTLAYLGQTLLQTIQLAQHEYINAFSTDSWRRVIYTHVKENSNYLAPPPAPEPAPPQTPQQLAAEAATHSSDSPDSNEAQTQPENQAPNPQPPCPDQAQTSSHATEPAPQGSTPTDPAHPSPTTSPSAQSPDSPATASSSSVPTRLPRRAAEFAATILASASSSPNPSHPLITGQRCVSVEAGLQPGSSCPDTSQRTRPSPAPNPPEQLGSQPPCVQLPAIGWAAAPELPSPTGPSGLPVLAALPPPKPQTPSSSSCRNPSRINTSKSE